MKNFTKTITSNKFVVVTLVVVALGVFMRSARAVELFLYSHDQDLAGWFVRDIVERHHLRLIGQETSVHGVYIGPAWYYAMTVVYFLGRMSPLSGLLLPIIVSAFALASMSFVFKEMFSKRVALFATLLYAVSFLLVMTDREVVPTTPVMLWSVWYLYSLYLFINKKTFQGLVLSAFLFAFSWNINLAMLILFPVSFVAFLYGKKLPSIKSLVVSVVVGVVTLSPFILFEIKNGFLQTKSILGSAAGQVPVDFGEKLDRTLTLLSKNIRGIFIGDTFNIPEKLPLIVAVSIFLGLVFAKKINLKWASLFALWTLLYVVFFSHNPLNLSEYYLNGVNVLWILLFGLFVDFLWGGAFSKFFLSLFLIWFVAFNVNRFYSQPVNKSGYLDRSAIVRAIHVDALLHGYPCAAVSYITSPGSNLGYRYLFYAENRKDAVAFKMMLPKSEAPVYTIVFPHTMVDKIDASFGALGLIYPDYKKYTKEWIEKSCEGPDQNLTEPLFGFTN